MANQRKSGKAKIAEAKPGEDVMPAQGKAIGKLAYAGLGASLAALLVVAGVAFWSTLQLHEDFQWVSHSQNVLHLLSEALGHLTDAESGQRTGLTPGSPRARQVLKSLKLTTRRPPAPPDGHETTM